MKARRPVAIDLFAGGGGLSSSLESVGWHTIAAVDNDPSAIATLHANQEEGWLEGTRIIKADVRDISGSDLIPENVELDLLAGGPPCQPFSSAGRMRAFDDPRGHLFQDFVRLARELQPRFILFENVAGLVTARSIDGSVGGVLRHIQTEFENAGYACRFELLNAADYGAAQRRVRLYMFASRKESLPTFPEPTHSKDIWFGRKPWITLQDFLASRSEPEPVDIVRPTAGRLKALLALAPGTGLKAQGIVEANRPSGHWGYRQDCFVADLRLPSRTIRAASTPDWIRLGARDLRRLTWRECAALQGFPRDWQFVGTIASRFRLIGNAVQGDVGRAIGETLFGSAQMSSKAAPVSPQWPASFVRRVKYTAMEGLTNGAHRRAARERNDANSSTLV